MERWLDEELDMTYLKVFLYDMPFSSRRPRAFPGEGQGLFSVFHPGAAGVEQIPAHLLIKTGKKEKRERDRKGEREGNGSIQFKPELCV